jgi:hypothetical protein
VAETDDVTVPAAALKVAVVLPAGTVTVPGTVTAVLLLDSETKTPPVGAGPLNVTVPVADAPLTTLAGLTAIEERETPTFPVSGMVTDEPAAMTTLSCICPPYAPQVFCEQRPVTGMLAALVVVNTTLTPGVYTPVTPELL